MAATALNTGTIMIVGQSGSPKGREAMRQVIMTRVKASNSNQMRNQGGVGQDLCQKVLGALFILFGGGIYGPAGRVRPMAEKD